MKTLGLIGGLSWESTLLYYRQINTHVKEALGGLHSARLLLYSFDFAEMAQLQKDGNWDEATRLMVDAGQRLKAGGADALVICTNTMHKMAAEVEAGANLPLIHIADCTGEAIRAQGLKRVGLLGTAFTMEQPFYKDRLSERFGLEVLVPDMVGRQLVHQVIYEELCRGIITDSARAGYDAVIADFKERGAQAVILGCTEIGLLLTGTHSHGLPLFDTTILHATYAADYALR